MGSREITAKEVSELFGRPFMGGMERTGVIASGREEEIERSVEDVLTQKPDKFILGADCTLPNEVGQETLWANTKTAISAAHAYPGRR